MAIVAPNLSPDLLKRLTYSKYLLGRAVTLQREGNELATAEAVLVAHDATEMLMRVVVDSLGAKPPDNFMQFWKNVAQKNGVEPPHKAAIDRLNNLRVGFKHLGNLPNPSVVGDLLPVVTAFCHEIASLYLKIDLETVGMADLIPNDEAREKVREAETEFEKGRLENAMLSLRLAYDKLFEQAGKTFGFFGLDAWEASLIDRNLAALIRHVNLISVGINPIRAQRAAKLMPGILRFQGGNTQVQWWRKPTAEEYEFCRDFVIDFGLRLVQSE